MSLSAPRFDRLFDELIDAAETERSGPPESRGEAHPGVAGTQPTFSAALGEALDLFYRGEYARCLQKLQQIEAYGAGDPRFAALLNACSSLRQGRLNPAIRACSQLLNQESHLGDIHCTLGVLLLKARRRSQAYRVFRRGLGVDPSHGDLRTQIETMGVRRPPVLPFLARSHPANRLLGLVRALILPA